MVQPPSGKVTFLFTDIEGSTKLWEQHPQAMDAALKRHDALMHQAMDVFNGYVFKTVGDAFCVAFASATDALQAALQAQKLFEQEDWEAVPMKVRMGLHSGEANERDGDYFGPPLNRTARLMGIGHGGQVLVSHTTQKILDTASLNGIGLKDLGHHRLKDLSQSEQVFQLMHPDLPQDFPDLNSLSHLANNLPAQTTRLIGRESDIEQVSQRLSASRLVTLTGIGGTGKTRLALQVGADSIERFADGVWLVELASVSSFDHVLQAIAQTLGVSESGEASIQDALKQALKTKHLLLILDNCEQVLAACSQIVNELLQACPELYILATSRERLDVPGETIWTVTPLPLPEAQIEIKHLIHLPSVALFVERAQAVKPLFQLTEENAAAVAHICKRLDGIPLALELAAARVKVMPPQKLVERLEDRFRYLTSGSQASLEHHQTLRATIDWSYDLLNESEKRLLNRLSVFRGGCFLEPAEAICSSEDLDELSILDNLSQLVQKSLVEVDDQRDEARYQLLETVRQYAREKLEESGELQCLNDKHLDFFLKHAEDIAPKLQEKDPGQWYQALNHDHGNLRSSLDWGLQQEKADQVLRLCVALAWFWLIQGYLMEGQAYTMRALEIQQDRQDDTQADGLLWAGIFTVDLGSYEEGKVLLEASLEQHQKLEDQKGVASVMVNLGIVENNLKNTEQARQLYEDAIEIYRQQGEQYSLGNALNNLGGIHLEQGALNTAYRLFEESLDICNESGQTQGVAIAMGNLGVVLFRQSDLNNAQIYFKKALEIYQAIGDRFGIASSLSDIAMVLHQSGKPQEAAMLQGASGQLLQTLNMPLEPLEKENFNRTQAALRQEMGTESYQKAFDEGRQLLLDQAVDLALSVE